MDAEQGLAARVAALRQRLREMGLSEPVAQSGQAATAEVHPALNRLNEIHQNLTQLKQQNSRIEASLAGTPWPSSADDSTRSAPEPRPKQLTYRSRRLLLHGRDLLEQLKGLSDIVQSGHHSDELATAYQDTLTMTELAVRALQALPDSAAGQLRVCDGVEALFSVIGHRVAGLRDIVQRRQADRDRIDQLAELLQAIVHQQALDWRRLEQLAESIWAEKEAGLPLRFVHVPANEPARFAAAHGLNVARVIARIAGSAGVSPADGRDGRAPGPILAALIHDAGMAALPAALLDQEGPLSDEQKRQMEKHAARGADALEKLAHAEGWLVDAVRAHHERQDGTGYPAGMQGSEIPKLARLLAVCDVYAALSSPRPHRAALVPRTALTETLLEAEKGRLDPTLAENLLELSFYPVGTIVELEDGQVGVVAATNPLRGSVATPARPVVQLLLTAEGRPLLWPNHLNLAQCTGRHIVRSLTAEEVRNVLGARHWQLL
jgi:HD-GYP domain-containing protein (c-di-GMP phosphodiesterase class II)